MKNTLYLSLANSDILTCLLLLTMFPLSHFSVSFRVLRFCFVFKDDRNIWERATVVWFRTRPIYSVEHLSLGLAADLLSLQGKTVLAAGLWAQRDSRVLSPCQTAQPVATSFLSHGVLLLVDPFYTRREGSRCLEHIFTLLSCSQTSLYWAMYATKALCMRVCARCFSALRPAFRLQLTVAVYSGKASQETMRSGYPYSMTRASTASP